ncbi:hypothetical protein AB2B41_06275 [Marimonas sp. MJW-29]|uniref:Cytochrome c domain-containing protein n=1 Tax=Sulfitobacter sediminis TaxID=3234186 RepID=A0ABV3RJQ3_9RHOB
MRATLSSIIFALAVLAGAAATADDRTVRLAAPDVLVENGFLKYLLPRFSLKTQVRVEVLPPGSKADAALGAEGHPLFEGEGMVWSLNVLNADHPGTARFVDWITSDIGMRTVTGFEVDGKAIYARATAKKQVVQSITFEGDAALGKVLSVTHCGRCHVSVDDQPMIGIGSTPSFFVLRALADWDYRFQAFFALNPHPSFTQIVDVTEPFPEDRPSPIVPIELTLDEFDAILAYVSALVPADLGAPLQLQ